MKMVDITCSKCGATLKPDFKKKRAFCEYCGGSFLFVQDESSGEITTKEQVTKEVRRSSRKIPLLILLVLMLLVFVGAFSWIVTEQSKPMVNPFDCITVSFHGKDGDGKVTIKAREGQDKMDVNRVVFDISKENFLRQGDTISIDVSSKYYRLEEKTKVYMVDGLDLYLNDLENLSAEEVEKLHEEAEKVLKGNLDISRDQDYLVDMKPVKIFLTTDGKRTNRLYDVYEVRYNTGNGEAVYYVWASFEGVIVKKDGQLSLRDAQSGCAGYPIEIQDTVSIIGYDSMEAVEQEIDVNVRGEIELKELDL